MGSAASTDPITHRVPLVTPLDDGPCELGVMGAKSANLARALRAGLPVVPGFVVTTGAARLTVADLRQTPGLQSAWRHLTENGARSLVVRSSSVGEDAEKSSMAGLFSSIVDVRGWDDFLDATRTVLDSARSAPLGGEVKPMAVLVQSLVDAEVGGILFGFDPVGGRRDRMVLVAAEGAPEALVRGAVEGTRYVLSRRGRTLDVRGSGSILTRRRRWALARLARHAEAAFGHPQDIEWAFDRAGRLWLLQSRPITAAAPVPHATGPLLGPGPIAETFPDPLAPLEQDLWVEPLRRGLVGALEVIGVVPRRRLQRSPGVVIVGGRCAVDLELFSATRASKRLIARLDPRPPVRRLAASWRIGRLRACVSELAEHLRLQVRAQVEAVARLDRPTEAELTELLRHCREMLVALNGQEILAGILLRAADRAPTAAARGLVALECARSDGVPEERIPALWPETLVLSPPRIGARPRFPTSVAAPDVLAAGSGPAEARESLRMTARIVQELSARIAEELGHRFTARGFLEAPELIRYMTFKEVEAAPTEVAGPKDIARRSEAQAWPPLPATFRLASDGTIVEASVERDRDGVGAAGGRAMGPVVKDPEAVADGDVLVVRSLDPRLASTLPRIAGLVAETGSVLSHLAILAREFGVPTVVGMPGACDRLRSGAEVVVDGTCGEVSVVPVRGAR